MAETLVQLVNEALISMGYGTTIQNLEEGTDHATVARFLVYPTIDEVINELDWKSCTKDETLTAQGPVDSSNRYQYRRPQDIIRYLRPKPKDIDTKGNFILGPFGETFSITYLYKNYNPALWSIDLTTCVRLLLTSKFCIALKNNHQKAGDFERMYAQQLEEAKFNQTLEFSNDQEIDPLEGEWNKARRASIHPDLSGLFRQS